MWLLGLFALSQAIAVAWALNSKFRRTETQVQRIEIPVPVASPYTLVQSARETRDPEPTIEELIDRLNIDVEQTARDAIADNRKPKDPKPVLPQLEADNPADQLDPALRTKLTAATAFRQRGDLARALVTLEALTQEAPDSAHVLYELALAYEDLQEPQRARRTYFDIFKLGSEKAGRFFLKANHKLNHGFGDPSLFRDKITFGTIRPKITTDAEGNRHVALSIPVTLLPGNEIDTSDLRVDVDFFDKVGQNEISEVFVDMKKGWLHPPVTWEAGEEIYFVSYVIPKPTAFEVQMNGKHEFYGYTAKLFYKGEAMDAEASPRSLFITRKKQADEWFPMPDENFLDGGLLPEKVDDFLPEE